MRKIFMLTGAILYALGSLALWPAYTTSHKGHVLRDEIFPVNVCYNVYLAATELRKTYAHETQTRDFRFEAQRTSEVAGREIYIYVIGEASRAMNWQLYGYERETNPLLKADSVVAIKAKSAATYTTEGVRAILSYKASKELFEILPNYLERNGADVVWRSTNWGEPPLHIAKNNPLKRLKERYPEADARYDALLLEGLRDEIEQSTKAKMLVVLHTSTSHGPTYYQKYPSEFERFTPVCTTVEMSKADLTELMNAYDNTILYTDYILHSVIEILRSLDCRSSMLFISDHGESLGENGLYMHGMPMSVAPAEQYEIPFIVWTSDGSAIKSIEEAEQYHIFHSVLDFLHITSPIYNEEYSVFAK
jgi:lipid A ethanolaminephosphotransferase